jgi:hypothetical protein
MRDQFVGDITDWIKFSLLRALAGEDRSLGISWYYIEDRAEAKPADLDRDVADALTSLGARTVTALESLPIWNGNTKFFRKQVPHTTFRKRWLEDMKDALDGADIVFLDPDNGLGQADALHATTGEVAGLRKDGRAVVLIHFPHFSLGHAEQISKHQQFLMEETNAKSIFTIKTRVTVQRQNPYGQSMHLQRARWFSVLDGDEVIRKRAKIFVEKLCNIKGCHASLEPESTND